MISKLKERINERSTWMLWMTSMGSIAALQHPYNIVAGVCLFMAGLVPDGAVKTDA